MDFNNQTGNLPFGLPMEIAASEQTKEGHDNLSEAEKEHLILKCKDAKTKEERDRIIDSISPEENVALEESGVFKEDNGPSDNMRDLFRGPSIG